MISYTKKLVIETSLQNLYEAITTETGLTSWLTKKVELYPHIGGIATFHFEKNSYAVMKIAKLVQNKEIVWKCVEQHSPREDTEKTDEWVGTTIRFNITENKDGQTELFFVQEGLFPSLFCYKDSESGWDNFFDSLKNYLEIGKGQS